MFKVNKKDTRTTPMARMIRWKLKVQKQSYSLNPLVIVWLSVTLTYIIAKSSLYKGLLFYKSYWFLGSSIPTLILPWSNCFCETQSRVSHSQVFFKKTFLKYYQKSQDITCVAVFFKTCCTTIAVCCFIKKEK